MAKNKEYNPKERRHCRNQHLVPMFHTCVNCGKDVTEVNFWVIENHTTGNKNVANVCTQCKSRVHRGETINTDRRLTPSLYGSISDRFRDYFKGVTYG